jgi:threonine dehydratase
MLDIENKLPTFEGIVKAMENLKGIVAATPLQKNKNLSELYEAQIFIKREDLQIVRSYKIRGAYNMMMQLNNAQKQKGVMCASAGNHAQGFAHSCYLLDIKGSVVMPATTPKQKIRAVKNLGKNNIEVILHGDTYDDAKNFASKLCKQQELTFIPPFDHHLIIEGQGTVALEILQQLKEQKPDYIFVPIGGGGLIAGIITYFSKLSPNTKIIGVEPQGAPAMKLALEKGKVVVLEDIDTFVDGAAVKQVGQITFATAKNNIEDMILVPEGKICTTILQLYNNDAIVAEPAGALSIAALDFYKEKIKGKKVVCILSGGNNDIERMPDIKERSQLYEGLKHYFIIRFPQRSGALKDFVNKVLGPDDDITLFEYTKKNSKESGPALVGIELKQAEDFNGLVERMKKYGVKYTIVNDDPILYNFLI